MSLSILIILLLACFGVTFTLMYAEILDIIPIRPLLLKIEFFKKLLHCAFCTGFWSSLFVGILFIEFKYIIPFALAGASVSYILDRITLLIDNLITQQEKK